MGSSRVSVVFRRYSVYWNTSSSPERSSVAGSQVMSTRGGTSWNVTAGTTPNCGGSPQEAFRIRPAFFIATAMAKLRSTVSVDRRPCTRTLKRMWTSLMLSASAEIAVSAGEPCMGARCQTGPLPMSRSPSGVNTS